MTLVSPNDAIFDVLLDAAEVDGLQDDLLVLGCFCLANRGGEQGGVLVL